MVDRNSPFVGDMLLQDFVDGRLDPKMAAQVKQVLADAPDLQRRAVEHMTVVHRLRQQFAAYDDAPLPPAIDALGRQLQHAVSGRSKRRRMPQWIGFAAAASIAAAVVAGLTWYGADRGGSAFMHSLDGFGVPTMDTAPHLAHTVAPIGRDAALPALAPDFAALGFKLLETRTIGRGGLDAVQLVYEAESGARVSLYYSDVADGAASRVAVREEGALSMLFWQDGKRAFSMIGEVDRETLLNLGRTVSGQSPFETMPGKAKPEIPAPERRTEEETRSTGRAV